MSQRRFHTPLVLEAMHPMLRLGVVNWRNVSDALAEPYTPPTTTIATRPAK